MNVVSPLYELSGDSSGVKISKCFAALITCVQFLSSVGVYVILKGLMIVRNSSRTDHK